MLMKSIKNTTKFSTNIWKTCIEDSFLEIIIQELPKLIDLTIGKVNKTEMKKFNSTLKRLVENPQNFQFNGKNIYDNALISTENNDESGDENSDSEA